MLPVDERPVLTHAHALLFGEVLCLRIGQYLPMLLVLTLKKDVAVAVHHPQIIWCMLRIDAPVVILTFLGLQEETWFQVLVFGEVLASSINVCSRFVTIVANDSKRGRQMIRNHCIRKNLHPYL